MQIFNKTIKLSEKTIEYFHEGMLLFDIETLGLSYRYAPIYLVGCMTRQGDEGNIKLFFAENRSQEPNVIKSFAQLCDSYDTLVTFNGRHFDLPYIMERAKKHGIILDLYEKSHIDLYRVAKKHKSLLGLNRLNQKSLEEFLGLYREDKYDGGALINVYKSYEKNQRNDLKELLLLHNYEDVKGMSTLLPLQAYSHLIESSFNISFMDRTQPDQLVFKGTSNIVIPKPIRILNDFCHILYSEDRVSGTFNTFNGPVKYFFKNYRDYVYLPLEDMIVPKALASTIPAERKEKACPENCCVKDTGVFLPLPSGKKIKSFINLSDRRIYLAEYKGKESYIKIDSSTEAELSEILIGLLSYTFS